MSKAPAAAPDMSGITGWLESRRGARWVWWALLAFATVLFLWLGSQRWFHFDDWSYIIYRDVFHPRNSLQARLWTSHNGHPVAVPAIQFSATSSIFGLDSYLPFIAVSVWLHLLSVVLLRMLMVRAGVTPLTATMTAAAVLLMGSSSEFPVFASISSYQYSLVALLATLLILDEYPDGAWQHYLAAVLGVIGSLASAFGALFVVGVAAATFGRRRWRTGATILVPQMLAFGWWWLTWGGTASDGQRRLGVSGYVSELYRQVFDALAGDGLGATVAVATLLIGVATTGWHAGSRIVWPLCITSLIAFAVIGFERISFGTESAAVGRYVVLGSFLVAPAFALTIDRIRPVSRSAYFAALVVVAFSISVNVIAIRDRQLVLADATNADRTMLELLAGSPQLSTLPLELRPSEYSPDIMIAHLGMLADQGAITPREPTTDAERAIVDEAIRLGALRLGG